MMVTVDDASEAAANVKAFLAMVCSSSTSGSDDVELEAEADQSTQHPDFFSDLTRSLLKVVAISRGRVTCSFTVIPAVVNAYKTLQGGVLASVAERVAVACATSTTVKDVGQHQHQQQQQLINKSGSREMVIGELSVSYLSAAPINAELIADASLLKGGRNVTVVSVQVKDIKTGKLLYASQATFFRTTTPAKL